MDDFDPRALSTFFLELSSRMKGRWMMESFSFAILMDLQVDRALPDDDSYRKANLLKTNFDHF